MPENAFSAGLLAQGDTCMLNFAGRHFLVKVLRVSEDGVEVSFPGVDYPVSGMGVFLEFYDETGFTSQSAEVVKGPGQGEDGMVLRVTEPARRYEHRASFRVTTDLTAQVKDQVHVRRYDAAVVDLGSGGALIRCAAPFSLGDTVELTLSLPREPTITATAQVAHVQRGAGPRPEDNLCGLRFLGLEPEECRSIERYTGQRLKEMYPDFVLS